MTTLDVCHLRAYSPSAGYVDRSEHDHYTIRRKNGKHSGSESFSTKDLDTAFTFPARIQSEPSHTFDATPSRLPQTSTITADSFLPVSCAKRSSTANSIPRACSPKPVPPCHAMEPHAPSSDPLGRKHKRTRSEFIGGGSRESICHWNDTTSLEAELETLPVSDLSLDKLYTARLSPTHYIKMAKINTYNPENQDEPIDLDAASLNDHSSCYTDQQQQRRVIHSRDRSPSSRTTALHDSNRRVSRSTADHGPDFNVADLPSRANFYFRSRRLSTISSHSDDDSWDP